MQRNSPPHIQWVRTSRVSQYHACSPNATAGRSQLCGTCSDTSPVVVLMVRESFITNPAALRYICHWPASIATDDDLESLDERYR